VFFGRNVVLVLANIGGTARPARLRLTERDLACDHSLSKRFPMNDLLMLLSDLTGLVQNEWPWMATSLLVLLWLWFRSATAAEPPSRKRSSRRSIRV
jgi:hypothetical protein